MRRKNEHITPGPWSIDWEVSEDGPSLAGPDDVVHVYISREGSQGRAEANAHLIAAAPELLDALQAVERTGQELGRFFTDDTLLLTPTIAAPVPPLGHLDTTNVDSMYRYASTYSALTNVANMTGQPAMSLPFATDAHGLPIGVQLVAAFGREDLLLQVASQIEAARPWSSAPMWPPRDA